MMTITTGEWVENVASACPRYGRDSRDSLTAPDLTLGHTDAPFGGSLDRSLLLSVG
jgi:hypothetical protein